MLFLSPSRYRFTLVALPASRMVMQTSIICGTFGAGSAAAATTSSNSTAYTLSIFDTKSINKHILLRVHLSNTQTYTP